MTYSQIIARLQAHQDYVYRQLFLNRNKDEVEWTILCTCLRGSQNYGLDHKDSDVDSVTIIVPTVHSLIMKHIYSKEYTLEKEKLTVVDIYSYIEYLKKGNPALLETTCTDYFVVPEKEYYSYKKDLCEMGKQLLYCQPKATAFSVIGNIFSLLNKVYRNDDYDVKAMSGAFRLYEWLVLYLKNELDKDAPFEMKESWFLREYWDIRACDRVDDHEVVYNNTMAIRDALTTNDSEKLEEQLKAKPIMLESSANGVFQRLANWYLKVVQEVNKI